MLKMAMVIAVAMWGGLSGTTQAGDLYSVPRDLPVQVADHEGVKNATTFFAQGAFCTAVFGAEAEELDVVTLSDKPGFSVTILRYMAPGFANGKLCPNRATILVRTDRLKPWNEQYRKAVLAKDEESRLVRLNPPPPLRGPFQ